MLHGGIDKDFELNRDKFIASTWIEFEHNGEKLNIEFLELEQLKTGDVEVRILYI